jgi:Tol biopolymer transport system component
MRAFRILLVLFAFIGIATFHQPVTAQAEPTAIIDTVMRDLSAKLGRTVNRVSSRYGWSQNLYDNAALGCPAPGVAYAAAQQLGYEIIVTVEKEYNYRSSNDGKNIFQCDPARGPIALNSGIGVIAATSTAAPIVRTAIPGAVNTLPPAPPPGAVNFTGVLPKVEFTVNTAGKSVNNPIAFVAADGNVYVADYTGGTITEAVPLTGDATGEPAVYYPYHVPRRNYTHLRWSPNGSALAFIDERNKTLYIARTGQKPVAVVTSAAIPFPPAWSADGSELYYAVMGGQIGDTTDNILQIQALPAAGGNPRVTAQGTFGNACGGAGFDSSYVAWMDASGPYGNTVSMFPFQDGVVYTPQCDGLALAKGGPANTQALWRGNELSSASLSPDRSRIAAASRAPGTFATDPGTTLVTVNPANGATSPLVTGRFTATGWKADGSAILFVTLNVSGQIATTTNNPIANNLFPGGGFRGDQYTVELWQIAPTGGQPTRILSREGRGISRPTGAADGSVVFTYTQSMGEMVRALNSGATNPVQVLAVAPRNEIHVLRSGAANSARIVIGSQFALGVGQFTAIAAPITAGTAPDPNAGVALPTLRVGGRAQVTTKAGSLNIRRNPSTTATLAGFLPQGTIVNVIGGPVSAEGYRWWQVQAPSGNSGWAVDQLIEDGQTINSLTPIQ